MEKPIQALGRELLSRNDGRATQIYLHRVTGLPPWKISRLLKRLEIFGFVDVEIEPRFTRGRPKKLYKLTANGIGYFTRLLGSDANSPELMNPRVTEGRWHE